MPAQLSSAPVLSGAVGRLTRSVKGNHPGDVTSVQKMLNIALCCPRLPEDGKVSGPLFLAIEDFQSSFMPSPDGVVTPRGPTFHRLEVLTVRKQLHLTLHPILITKGGYKIAHNAKSWPANYRLYLTCRNTKLSPADNLQNLSELDSCLDITEQPPDDALNGSALLPDFLSLMEKLGTANAGFWGNRRWCALYVTRDNCIISSAEAPFTSPFQPFDGTLTMNDINASGLPYHDPSALLNPNPINGKHWFQHSSRFATLSDPPRGLNCVTYPMAVYRLLPHPVVGKPGYDGEEIANDLAPNAPNDINGKSYDDAMDFLVNNRSGAYLMWYEYGADGHTVLIVDGVAHEWSQSHNGYWTTPIPQQNSPTSPVLWGNRSNAAFYIREMPRP
jgi:hypothetical protein